MLEGISEDLFQELIAFEHDSPAENGYIHTARICTVIYNRFEDVLSMIAGGKPKYAKMGDFLPNTYAYEIDENADTDEHPGMDKAEEATRRIAERRARFEAQGEVSSNGH